MKPDINSKAKEQIKEVLRYLKIARSADHLTYHTMVSGGKFKDAVLIPLEKLADWNQEDEKEMGKIAQKLENETQGKTAKERVEKLHKILKIGSSIATGAGILTGITLLLKNHKNGK